MEFACCPSASLGFLQVLHFVESPKTRLCVCVSCGGLLTCPGDLFSVETWQSLHFCCWIRLTSETRSKTNHVCSIGKVSHPLSVNSDDTRCRKMWFPARFMWELTKHFGRYGRSGCCLNNSSRRCKSLILQNSFCPPASLPPSPRSQIPKPGRLPLAARLRNSAKLEGKIASGWMSWQKAATLNSWAQTSLTICQISVINYHEQVAWFYLPQKKRAAINALSGASNGLMNVLFIGMNIHLHWLLRSGEPLKCVKSKHSGRIKTRQTKQICTFSLMAFRIILRGRNAN